MTDEELNKRLHEILGLCWHEDDIETGIYYPCPKCINHDVDISVDFLTWEGFGVLWEWLQKQEKFQNFLWKQDGDNCCLSIDLINPRALALAVVVFFKEEK